MSGDTDLIKLYSGRILALAADMPRTERLADPHATVKKRSPLCGSTIAVDVILQDGKVSEYGQDVKACALGQAAASVVGANVVGLSRTEIETARDALKDMLKNDGPAPAAPFEDLEVLRPARDYKNRHASIMLALEATLEAIDQAEQSACA
ncbi:iron-sulfur cluster assembly scaffold protein [Cognatishimia sp. D5M38]|uniref:Iron-sulfur cluster assembly scaffold protein n=1 Tax=Cognatishimia coralii TaxID=3083254 RepID=A0ABU8QCY4_9RHOB